MKNLLISLLLCLLAMGAQAQLKPRVVILTDIGQPCETGNCHLFHESMGRMGRR